MRFFKFIFVFLMLGLSACRAPNASEDPAAVEKQKLANQVRRKAAAQLKKETDLRPIGTIGQMFREIERLGLSFQYYKPIDIAEGRKLLVQAVQVMLNGVQQEKKIHSYLCRNPFLPRNIEIQIFLRNPDNTAVSKDSLSVIEAEGGMLRYQIHHPKDSGFITVYEETFDEALQRIADPSLPLVPFKADREPSQEGLRKLREDGIRCVANDGSIWYLAENGCWVQGPHFYRFEL